MYLDFIYKEIKDTSIIDTNINKTVGNAIETQINNENKTITLQNIALSGCNLNDIAIKAKNNKILFNQTLFKTFQHLKSEESQVVTFQDISSQLHNIEITSADLKYDIIEDIQKEIVTEISQESDLRRYIAVLVDTQLAVVNSIQIHIEIMSSQSQFDFKLTKDDLKNPIKRAFNFSFIAVGQQNKSTEIKYTTKYFDINYNELQIKEGVLDYNETTSLRIIKYKSNKK